jgi:hypothetical protein
VLFFYSSTVAEQQNCDMGKRAFVSATLMSLNVWMQETDWNKK